MADNDLSIAISQPAFFDGTDRRDLLIGRSECRALTFSTPIHVAGQARDSFGQSRCIKISDEFRRQAILTVLYFHPAEHHFRVSNEVLVDLNLPVWCPDSGQFGP